MLIEEVFTRHGLGMDYDISQDKDYLHVDYNESSAALYDYIKSKAISTFCQLRHTRHAVVMNTKTSKDGKSAQVLDLLDTGGDLTLVSSGIKDLINITNVRNETFKVVTSAGPGVQQRDKVGYEILSCQGKPKAVTAHMTGTLGNVNGFDLVSTKCIIDGFEMPPKLAEYFMGKIHYNAEPINGVMGLKNASDIMYDVAPRDIGIIHPPWLPNLRFSKYSPTNELMCWGSFGLDPDVFKISSPTFYVHKDQIDSYCKISGQNPSLVKPLLFPSDFRQELDDVDNQPEWMKEVAKPVLDFVSLLETENLHAQVPDEMLINLHEPVMESNYKNGKGNENFVNHLWYHTAR